MPPIVYFELVLQFYSVSIFFKTKRLFGINTIKMYIGKVYFINRYNNDIWYEPFFQFLLLILLNQPLNTIQKRNSNICPPSFILIYEYYRKWAVELFYNWMSSYGRTAADSHLYAATTLINNETAPKVLFTVAFSRSIGSQANVHLY